MQMLLAMRSDIKAVKDGQTSLTKQLQKYKQETSKQIHELKIEKKSLNNSIAMLKKENDRHNLVIHGMVFDSSETEQSLATAANAIFTQQLKINNVTIDKVYRITSTSNTGPVVVKLIFEREKELILSSCNKLRGTEISISEDLPKQDRVRYSVFRRAINEAGSNNKHYKRNGDMVTIDGKVYEVVNGNLSQVHKTSLLPIGNRQAPKGYNSNSKKNFVFKCGRHYKQKQ